MDKSQKNTRFELVDDSFLMKLDARPSLPNYFIQMWRRRYFISAEAKSKAFSSGRDTYLGKLWLILDPLFQVSVYVLVFGFILQVSRGIDNFIGFLVLGVIFFGFISKGINAGSMLIQKSRNLITSFKFPRMSVAYSTALRQLLDNALPAVVAVVLACVFQGIAEIHWSILAVIPLYFMIHFFNLGVILIVSRSTAFIPDLKSLISLLSRALFFVSGVFFSIERFEVNSTLRIIVEVNPVYQFLTAVRMSVLDGVFPSLGVWLYLSGWTMTLLFFGSVYFWLAEERYIHVK